ncbi:hypothetical protein Btru_052769 [Bulinus truncatus]|nr:hypothetical protein Btru_052769 [Bulinus truncatus]
MLFTMLSFNKCEKKHSFIGFVSNIVSLAILRRSGLHKPSNVLLLGMVVADNMCLMITMNYAAAIMNFGPDKAYPGLCGFQYSDTLNYFLIVSGEFFSFVGHWGRYASTSISVFITVERLLAIFKPMNFKSIVTVRNAFISVLFSYAFWLPWNLFLHCLDSFVGMRLQEGQQWVVVVWGDLFTNNQYFIEMFYYCVVEGFALWFPFFFVCLGSFALMIKIKIATRERRKLTASEEKKKTPSKTTRTLLTTCLVFSMTHVANCVLVYVIPNETVIHQLLRKHLSYFMYVINASASLLIYVTTNKNFFNIFIKILHHRD